MHVGSHEPMHIERLTTKLVALAAMLWMPGLLCAQFDDGARYAFVASQKEKSVYVIDLHDRQTAGRLKFDQGPDSIVASEFLRALVVGHSNHNSLTLVDLTSDTPDQYPYPLSIRPDLVLMSPIGETVAVLDRSAKILEIHALRRREVLVRVENIRTGTRLTFSGDGSVIYWTDRNTGMLHSADLWGTRNRLRLASEGSALSAMSRSVDGRLGFISDADSGLVHVVDLREFQSIRTSRAGRAPLRPWGTADGRYMLVPSAVEGTVTAISTLTGAAIYTVAAVSDPVSINPGWIDTVAAVVSRTGEVVFIRIDTGEQLARSQLQGAPEEGIVTSDSKTLAIPVPGAGSMVFFDMRRQRQLSAIDALPLDIGSAALAISNNLCH